MSQFKNTNGDVNKQSLGSYDRKQRYRALLEDLSTLDDNTDNVQQIEHTSNAVHEVQNLLEEGDVEERVKHPGEGYLDSRVLRLTSELALRCSETVSGNVNTYDKHELAKHIRENPSFWELTFPFEVPAVAYLYGTFAPTPPEQLPRAPRKKVEKQRVGALKAPESVDKLEKTEEGPEMVSRVHRFVTKTCRSGPLSYFHAVLDPDSFSRTVENVYHVSFLVRDGMIAIDVDERYGLPFITPVAAEQQDRRVVSSENQFIVSLDVKTWRELVAAFDIKTPLMVLKRR